MLSLKEVHPFPGIDGTGLVSMRRVGGGAASGHTRGDVLGGFLPGGAIGRPVADRVAYAARAEAALQRVFNGNHRCITRGYYLTLRA